jgi:hypothetical protein
MSNLYLRGLVAGFILALVLAQVLLMAIPTLAVLFIAIVQILSGLLLIALQSKAVKSQDKNREN